MKVTRAWSWSAHLSTTSGLHISNNMPFPIFLLVTKCLLKCTESSILSHLGLVAGKPVSKSYFFSSSTITVRTVYTIVHQLTYRTFAWARFLTTFRSFEASFSFSKPIKHIFPTTQMWVTLSSGLLSPHVPPLPVVSAK
jgi:hypothetical protein